MIETARLRLRPWRAEDRPRFGDLFNTSAMTARLGGVRTEEGVDALFAKRMRDQEMHGHCYWAVEMSESAELVGSCGVRIASNYPGTPVEGMREIGWRIGTAYQGRGYAREAAKAALDWAWTELDAREVGAWTTIANRPSWRLMERLGMKRREDLDFRHPDYPPDAPLGAMIVYVAERTP